MQVTVSCRSLPHGIPSSCASLFGSEAELLGATLLQVSRLAMLCTFLDLSSDTHTQVTIATRVEVGIERDVIPQRTRGDDRSSHAMLVLLVRLRLRRNGTGLGGYGRVWWSVVVV